MQGKFWLHAATNAKYSLAMTNQTLTSNYLTLKDSMWSSQHTLHYKSPCQICIASFGHSSSHPAACSLQGNTLMDAATVTTKTLAREELIVTDSMSSSKGTL